MFAEWHFVFGSIENFQFGFSTPAKKLKQKEKSEDKVDKLNESLRYSQSAKRLALTNSNIVKWLVSFCVYKSLVSLIRCC